MIKQKFLGYVAVDGGQVIIADPCYLAHWKNNDPRFDGKDFSMSYNGACNASLKKDMGGQICSEGMASAVVASSGLGDGSYPVYAKYINTGTKENPDIRIKELTIKFL